MPFFLLSIIKREEGMDLINIAAESPKQLILKFPSPPFIYILILRYFNYVNAMPANILPILKCY